jgi:hypothetical protein
MAAPYPSRAKLTVKSPAAPIAMVQGVRQSPPSDDCASASAGADWRSNTVVVGFGSMRQSPEW